MRHHSSVRSLVGLLVSIFVIGLGARSAHACKCMEDTSRVALVRPVWPAASGLVLSAETVELDCSSGYPCTWRSTHVYTRAEPGAPARVAMQLPFNASPHVEVRFGGAPVSRAEDEAEDEAELTVHDASYGNFGETHAVYYWLDDDGTRSSVVLSIEGPAFANGVRRGRDRFDAGCCHYTALEVRHPWVPVYRSQTSWAWTEAEPEGVAPSTRLRVRVTPGKRAVVDFEHPDAPRPRREPAEISVASRAGLRWGVVEPLQLTGGPFIAFGGSILDHSAPRGRIGWEHAHPLPFLFYSAALETDFTTELSVVPAIEISHGRGSIWWFVPTAGLGVGVPVQLLPDPRPAVRAQASLSWRVLSFLTMFDYFMPLGPTERRAALAQQLRLSFMGQLAF